MSDKLICPECNDELSIEAMELWKVYDSDGEETEINCPCCDKELLITSRVTGWEFDVESLED